MTLHLHNRTLHNNNRHENITKTHMYRIMCLIRNPSLSCYVSLYYVFYSCICQFQFRYVRIYSQRRGVIQAYMFVDIFYYFLNSGLLSMRFTFEKKKLILVGYFFAKKSNFSYTKFFCKVPFFCVFLLVLKTEIWHQYLVIYSKFFGPMSKRVINLVYFV